MVQISGVNDRFLQAPVVLSEIMRILDPYLAFDGIIPYVDSGGEPVTYLLKASKSSDAKKQTPRMMTPSSKFPEVEITRMTKKSALLSEEGLAIRLDKDAIQKKAGVDMIMDSYQTVGFWLAEYINSRVYSVLDGGSTNAGVTPGGVWHTVASATPMEDLRKFKNSIKREGYPYRMTDIFLEMVNFNELEGFLLSSEIPAYREAAIASGNSEIALPMEGKPIAHGLFSSITHGDYLGMDKNNPGSALYYHNDPQFSTGSISYDTNTGSGAPTVKTVKNFGLSTHKYFEDDTHDTIIQLWFDNVVVVKDAYSIVTDESI
jgi:hypothetical protein